MADDILEQLRKQGIDVEMELVDAMAGSTEEHAEEDGESSASAEGVAEVGQGAAI